MTFESMIESFCAALEKRTGMQVLVMPQSANGNTAHLELYLSGLIAMGQSSISSTGDGTEQVSFNCVLRSSGSHKKWLSRLLPKSRIMTQLAEDARFIFTIPGADRDPEPPEPDVRLTAVWRRSQNGSFEYPGEDEKSMPVSYAETFSVDIKYPAALVTE